MRRQFIYLSLFVFTVSILSACAQSKSTKSKATGNAYAKIRSSGTIKKDNSPTIYSFYIVWKKKETPEAFYWRGEDGWTDCSVDKVQGKNVTRRNNDLSATGMEFTTEIENIPLDRIKPGNYLKITTIPGGKNLIPSAIPQKAKNRLYFKIADKGWLYITK